MRIDDNLPSEVYRYIGSRLRQIRVDRGLTQTSAASILGVSPQQYQKYEDASSKISLVHIYTLVQHYGLSLDAILPVRETPTPEPRQSAQEEDVVSDTDLVARLVTNFVAISDRRLRQSIVDIVEATRNSTQT
jgi:transcriptional regulator with XRE-family HTH domain